MQTGSMYYAEISVPERIDALLDDWDLLDDRVIKKLTTFKEIGENVVGVRRRLVTKDPVTVIDPGKGLLPESVEIGPSGLITQTHEILSLRITVGGAPHRVPHSMGFWHINDVDELYLTLPPPAAGEPAYFLVIMGNPKPSSNEGERLGAILPRVPHHAARALLQDGRSLGWTGIGARIWPRFANTTAT